MRQIAFLVLFVFALLPAGASASSVNCSAPAGTSGIDQYCEVLPGAGGSGSNHHKKKKHVSTQVQQTLQSQGSDGAAILQLTQSSGAADAQTTTPPPAAKKKVTHKKKKSSAAPTTSTPATPTPAKTTPQAQSEGPSPSNNPFSAVSNSTGISGGFTWILVGILLVFVAMGWISYRGRGPEPDAS
jgi:cobalamin biosynthesis Mg chelatase CobN